jgi:hypothetical protein
MDTKLGEQVHHVGVRSEENVKASLDPVPVLVLPGRDLAAKDVSRFINSRLVARIGKVFCCSQSGQATCKRGSRQSSVSFSYTSHVYVPPMIATFFGEAAPLISLNF